MNQTRNPSKPCYSSNWLDETTPLPARFWSRQCSTPLCNVTSPTLAYFDGPSAILLFRSWRATHARRLSAHRNQSQDHKDSIPWITSRTSIWKKCVFEQTSWALVVDPLCLPAFFLSITCSVLGSASIRAETLWNALVTLHPGGFHVFHLARQFDCGRVWKGSKAGLKGFQTAIFSEACTW